MWYYCKLCLWNIIKGARNVDETVMEAVMSSKTVMQEVQLTGCLRRWEGEYCLALETKPPREAQKNELHTLKIQGCEALKNERSQRCLVVYRQRPRRKPIMGWYQHATGFIDIITMWFWQMILRRIKCISRKKILCTFCRGECQSLECSQ